MRRILGAGLFAMAACGGGGGNTPDASNAHDDAAPIPDATPLDAGPSCNVVFLELDGVALTAGADQARRTT